MSSYAKHHDVNYRKFIKNEMRRGAIRKIKEYELIEDVVKRGVMVAIGQMIVKELEKR